MSIKDIIPIVISILALLISAFTLIVNFFLTKKKISTEIITSNRINWISDVRNLVSQFMDVYINHKSTTELTLIRNKISLYLRDNVKSYSILLKELDLLIADKSGRNDCNDLITAAQNVFSEVWIRTKREAYISGKIDNKFEKMFNNPK